MRDIGRMCRMEAVMTADEGSDMTPVSGFRCISVMKDKKLEVFKWADFLATFFFF